MISLISTIVGLVLGGGSIWGLALKVAGWLGWGWPSSALATPVLGLVSGLALRLVDFLLWLVKGALRWLGGGLNVVSKSPPAAALVVCIAIGAWKFGPGDWRFWDATPPAVISEPSRSAPTPRRRATKKTCVDPLSACFWGL